MGELTLTLCYLPAAGRLTVTIVKAFNLKSMDINGKSGKNNLNFAINFKMKIKNHKLMNLNYSGFLIKLIYSRSLCESKPIL